MNSNASVLEYTRFKVRSRMSLANAAQPAIDQVMSDMPIHLQSAIVGLQRVGIIPPKEIQIDLGAKEEHHYNRYTTDLLYTYVRLPDDFRELKHFNLDPISAVDYKPVINEYEAIRRQSSAEYFFCIRENAMIEDGPPVPRLVLAPWPKDSILILSYFTTGDTDSLDHINRRDWDAIADRVMADLGLMDRANAEITANEALSYQRNPYGQSATNGAAPRVALSFFGGRKFKA